MTYDIVNISGQAITNTYAPPTISSFPNTNTLDYVPLTLNFTVSSSSTPPDSLAYSAQSLNPAARQSDLRFRRLGRQPDFDDYAQLHSGPG